MALVSPALAAPIVAVLARPIGAWAPAGYAAAGPSGGPLVGAEVGGAVQLPVGDDPTMGSFAFGARAGWAFANGLALHLRYDYLGTRPAASPERLQLATAGLRYSLPFVIPLPFAEVDLGPAFVAGGVRFGAGVGLGITIPVVAHVLVDVVARDWLVPTGGALRQTLTGSLGLTVTFASP